MKPILVKDQVQLSAARCLYLTFAGMYYRITRSVITVTIVALAVAFLSYMLSYSIFVQDLTSSASKEFQESRLLGEWVARLNNADEFRTVVAGVVSGDTIRAREYCRWSGTDESQYITVRDACGRFNQFLIHFRKMRKASSAVLLGDTDPYVLPELLLNPEYMSVFQRQLKELSLAPPLGSQQALDAFLQDDWPLMRGFFDKVLNGQHEGILQVQSSLAGRPLIAVLIESPRQVQKFVQQAGFVTSDAMMQKLGAQAVITNTQEQVLRIIGSVEVKNAIARVLDIDKKKLDLEELTRWIGSLSRAQEFCRIAGGLVPSGEVVPKAKDVLVMARAFQRTEKLQQAIGDNPVQSNLRGLAALPQTTKWLIVVSFIVCAVGICNTMFMSVTERFTEIATMKCLGAMDSFVMLLFVFEAVIQGLAGSLCGIVLGFILTILRGAAGYGGMFFKAIPLDILFMTVGFSLLAGVFLAAVSAVGPAWMAARLAPMEAMRVE